jgi:hypothetical protein
MPTDPAPRFAVIIPACDEEPCLGVVLDELRAALAGQPHLVAVGVNGSTDRTAEIARTRPGVLVAETTARGYGHGCRAAVDLVGREHPPVDGYIFFAADGANDPRDIAALLAARERGAALVLGCRTRTLENWRLMNLQYVIANRLFGAFCGLLTGRFFADLGPLRFIERDLFHALRLREWTMGWTIEAQVRAARLGAAIVEVCVRERERIGGQQKVSRVSLGRTVSVGLKILAAGFRARFGDYLSASEPNPVGLAARPGAVSRS